MYTSDSDDCVSTSLLGKRAAPPPHRSTKSVVSQVKDTLFSFIKRARGESNKENDKHSQNMVEEIPHSISQKQRSFESFSERVATFTVANWMGKPLSLSPPLFAQYGWQCIGVDTVKCCSCSALFCVNLPWPDEDNYWQKCHNYREKVITAHMKICSWPSYPCADSVIAPLSHGCNTANDVLAQFIQRRDNLMFLGDKLPNLDLEMTNLLNLNEKDLQILVIVQTLSTDVSDADTPIAEESSVNLSQNSTAAILAMCGWDTSRTSSPPSIFCKSSGRVMSLRNFFSISESDIISTEDETSQADDKLLPNETVGQNKNARDSITIDRVKTTENGDNSPSHLRIKKQNFHPLQQHCPWSYWITVLKPISKEEFEKKLSGKLEFLESPFAKDAKPGWLVVRDALLGQKITIGKIDTTHNDGSSTTGQILGQENEASVQRTPTKSPVHHVQKLLREWSSPK